MWWAEPWGNVKPYFFAYRHLSHLSQWRKRSSCAWLRRRPCATGPAPDSCGRSTSLHGTKFDLGLPRPRWCASSTYSVCSCRLTKYSEMQNAKEKNAKTMCHDMMGRNLLMTCSKTHYVHGPHPLARFHPAASHLHASSQGILHLLDMLLLYVLHERLEDFVNLMSQSESSMDCWIAFFPKQLIYIVYSYASSAQDRRTCGPPGQLRRKLRPSTSKQVWRTWQLQRCHEENTTASTAPEVLGPRKPNRKVAPGTTVKICVERKTAWFNNSTDSGMVIVTVSKLNLCLTTLLAKHLRTR